MLTYYIHICCLWRMILKISYRIPEQRWCKICGRCSHSFWKCVKTKKQGCCCFYPFKLKTPHCCSQSGGQGQLEIKIFVRKGTKKNIGFTCCGWWCTPPLLLHHPSFCSHKQKLLTKRQQNIYENLTLDKQIPDPGWFLFFWHLNLYYCPPSPLLGWRTQTFIEQKKSIPAINFVRWKVINFNNWSV